MKKMKRFISGLLVTVMALSLTVQGIPVSAAEIGAEIDEVFISDETGDSIDDSDDGNGQNDVDNPNEETMDSDNTENNDETNDSDGDGMVDDKGDCNDTDNPDDNNRSDEDKDSDISDDSDENVNNDDVDETDQTDESGEDGNSDDTEDTDDTEETDQSDESDETDESISPDDTDEEGASELVPSEIQDWEECQYIIFPDNQDDITYSISETQAVIPIEYVASTTVYAVNASVLEELEFEASVSSGYKLELPKQYSAIIKQKKERDLVDERWVYSYKINIAELSTTIDEPLSVRLRKVLEEVLIDVTGDAVVEGVDENGMAQIGSIVTIEVLNAGETLALVTKDDKGNTVYSAMELDYENRYEFIVEEETEFIVVNPDNVTYVIANADTRKAKLTGEAGLQLKSLTSSAQGYKEIVLNFTAVPNGSDGTEAESVYYEVKVVARPKQNETIPETSLIKENPQYYYIKKTADVNTQSKSIIVNSGISETTACTYEFSVRLVYISNTTSVPEEDTPRNEGIDVVLSGNTIVKSFATKNLYYEDKLGFTKKTTKVYTGQTNVLTGLVKYSKNASYLHDLTAVVYNSGGGVCSDIACSFKNDNDELYVSVDEYTQPGKYTVAIYAGIGDASVVDNPQSGTMYQANTSFTLTVLAGINYINTYSIKDRISVTNKNVSFSAAPIGYSGDHYKSHTQRFTYEIKSAVKDSSSYDGYKTIEPTNKVKSSISVNKNGKVTIKKGYTVDPDTGEDYIAIVIKAADFDGNDTTATAYVRILNTVLVPTEIYLTDSDGNNLGTSFYYNKAIHYQTNTSVRANVIVLDQYGNNMNQYVTLTPGKYSANKNYVSHSTNSSYASLIINKLGTITIKAEATDGGKKSKTVKFTVKAPSFTETFYSVLSITHGNNDLKYDFGEYDYDSSGKGYVNYRAPKGAVIKAYFGANINENAYYNRSWFNWKYEVQGGKLKFNGNYWLITPTARTTTVRYWLKSNPSRAWKVSFTNTNWNSTYEATPQVKLVSGKLYSNKYSNSSEVVVYEEWEDIPDQLLTYRYTSGDYDSIRVTRKSNKAPYLWVESVDTQNKTFMLSGYSWGLKAGSYKYSVAFYKNGILAGKPATITVKISKSSKVKIAASYTLNTNLSDSVALKCTPKEFVPDYETKLLNANVGGKANDFSTYFELTTSTNSDGVKTASIKFKNSVTPEQKAALKGKTLTGYVKYSYYLGDSYIENATSKVSIKIK